MNNFPKPYQLYSAFHAGYIFETYFDGNQWWNLKTGQPVDGDINDDRLYRISEAWSVSLVDMYGVTLTLKVNVPVDLPACREHEQYRWKARWASLTDEAYAGVLAYSDLGWHTEDLAPHVKWSDEAWLKDTKKKLIGKKRTANAEPIKVEVKEIA